MSAIMTLEEVRPILGSYLPLLYGCLEDAWDDLQDFLDCDPSWRVTLTPTNLPAMMHSRWTELVEARMSRENGITIERRGRKLSFVTFDNGRLALRLKKLNSALRSGNVRTGRQDAIYHQRNFLDQFNTIQRTHATFGYVPDASLTDFDGVWVTCPKSYEVNHWVFPVAKPSTASKQISVLPTTPTPAHIIIRPRAERRKASNQ